MSRKGIFWTFAAPKSKISLPGFLTVIPVWELISFSLWNKWLSVTKKRHREICLSIGRQPQKAGHAFGELLKTEKRSFLGEPPSGSLSTCKRSMGFRERPVQQQIREKGAKQPKRSLTVWIHDVRKAVRGKDMQIPTGPQTSSNTQIVYRKPDVLGSRL